VRYRASPDSLASVLPAEVEPSAGAPIGFEWRRTLANPASAERIDAAVVVPCRYRGMRIGYELRHYCDQLRPSRQQAGIACDGGPDFYAKLVAAPSLHMGTLHDGDQLVAAAILSPSASASADGMQQAADWLALPRLKPADIDRPAPHAGVSDRAGRLAMQRAGAVTFRLHEAPSGAFVAPAAETVLDGQFFVVAPASPEPTTGVAGL
jgi:hypothetical protein